MGEYTFYKRTAYCAKYMTLENTFEKKTIQVFPCPSQPVTIVAALFGRAGSQIAKVGQM